MISFGNFVEGINSAIIKANDFLQNKYQTIIDSYFEEVQGEGEHADHSTMRPKSVCIQYPNQGPDGKLNMVDVDVPLITLVPIEFSQIEKVKITAQFEVQVVNNEVQVNFTTEPPKKWSLFGKSKSGTGKPGQNTGQIEITIKPSESPDGLRSMIEGYEKVLRAQIPH